MSGDYRVPAVVLAAKVLRELGEAGEHGMTAAELCRATETSKSSMHNLLGTLVGERFLVRDERSREYRLGPALMTLGAAAAGQTKIIDIASAKLAELAAREGLSFAIGQPVSLYEVVVVERFYPPGDVHVGVRLGATYGLYEGAIGKCLLACLPDAEVRRILRKRKVPAYTERTLTDPDRMLAEVREVRAAGWAAARGELNENNAVATAVLGSQGQPELFLLALGFAEELNDEGIVATGELLLGAATEVRRAAGIEAEARGEKVR